MSRTQHINRPICNKWRINFNKFTDKDLTEATLITDQKVENPAVKPQLSSLQPSYNSIATITGILYIIKYDGNPLTFGLGDDRVL